MKKQAKESKMDLFYLEEENKNKKRAEKKNSAPKKKQKEKEELESTKSFNFNNEIVIGVKKLPDEKEKESPSKKNKKSKPKKKKSEKKKVENKPVEKKEKKLKNLQYEEEFIGEKKTVKKSKIPTRDQEKKKKKIKRILKITQWTILLLLIAGTTVYIMMSPIFNVKTIIVEGEVKLTKQEIVSLSGVQENQNMFRFSTSKAQKNIGQNAYIDSVKITRGLPDTIKIIVIERKPTFMLEYGNGYVYLNNQGYMLEISEEKKEIPILVGMKTTGEEIEVGKRLISEDLVKMAVVLQIMESANSNEIENKISRIDVTDKKDYRIYMEQEEKIGHLGDCTNLSTRILYLKAIMENRQGIAGEIFVDMDLNTSHPVFREKV